jgi:hypothetical protein
MEIFTAFAGELERSIAWGSGGFTTLGGAVARVQRKTLPGKNGRTASTSHQVRRRESQIKIAFLIKYRTRLSLAPEISV